MVHSHRLLTSMGTYDKVGVGGMGVDDLQQFQLRSMASTAPHGFKSKGTQKAVAVVHQRPRRHGTLIKVTTIHVTSNFDH